MENITPVKEPKVKKVRVKKPVLISDPATIKKVITAAINKQCVLPQLRNVFLNDDHIIVSDLSVHVVIPYKPTSVKALIPSVIFKTLFEHGNFKDVKPITGKYDSLTWVSNDKTEIININVDSVSEYVKINQYEYGKLLGLLDQKAIDQTKKAKDFVSHDEMRPVMGDVLIEDEIAATDAHCLYYEKIEKPFISPVKFKPSALKIIQLLGGTWEVFQYGSQIICLSDQRVKVIFTETDGRYPNYKAVIPKFEETPPIEMNIDQSIIKDMIMRASIFTNRTTRTVNLKIEDERLTLYVDNLDFGYTYTKTVPCETNGSMVVAFNYLFLLKVLNRCSGVVNFKMIAPEKATIINDQYLVMPVNMNR